MTGTFTLVHPKGMAATFTVLSATSVKVVRWSGYAERTDVLPIATARTFYAGLLKDGYARQ